eukprot:6081041-Amphidinium_carterae.1
MPEKQTRFYSEAFGGATAPHHAADLTLSCGVGATHMPCNGNSRCTGCHAFSCLASLSNRHMRRLASGTTTRQAPPAKHTFPTVHTIGGSDDIDRGREEAHRMSAPMTGAVHGPNPRRWTATHFSSTCKAEPHTARLRLAALFWDTLLSNAFFCGVFDSPKDIVS